MLPHWPFQRQRLEALLGPEGSLHLPEDPCPVSSAEEEAPTVIWHRQGRIARVLLCSKQAEVLGIRPGMTLAEAIALAGRENLRGQAWDPVADRRVLEALGYFCQQFSPQVAVDPGIATGMVWIDITTTAFYFGGEEALCCRLAQALSPLGLTFRIAVADTASATWAICHYGWEKEDSQNRAEGTWRIIPPGKTAEALRPLPVACLRVEEEVVDLLSQLGIYTLDQLARVPPQEWCCRFGPQLWRRWQEAIGHLPEALSFLPTPETLKVCLASEWPIEERDDLLRALSGLVDKILPPLVAKNEGVLALRCVLGEETGTPPRRREIPVELLFHQPTVNREHILGVLEVRLEGVSYQGGIRQVELLVLQTAPLSAAQGSFGFAGQVCQRSRPGQISQVVDRLQARLGSGAICLPVLTGEVQPERSWAASPVGGRLPASADRPPGWGKNQAEKGKALPRPATLLAQPIPVRYVIMCPLGTPAQFVFKGKHYRVVRAWGPERIETGWWRGQKVRRDYYRAETITGQRFWLFRQLDTGQWFLHGFFD